jgi:hypothetical protein
VKLENATSLEFPQAIAKARDVARIVVCFSDGDERAAQIVSAALLRSFSETQVAVAAAGEFGQLAPAALVWINPPESAAGELARHLSLGSKVLVLGHVGPRIGELLGLEVKGALDWPADWGACVLRDSTPFDVSPAAVRYLDAHPLAAASPYDFRPLCRFDFADEWNNLGYGRIVIGPSLWSIAVGAGQAGATPLAIVAAPENNTTLFATVHDAPNGSALWFNRPVGPVDSLEWRIVEAFFDEHRAGGLPCLASLAEVPGGYRAAACARLDCDEAVASAAELFELYRSNGLPLSLALLTGQSLQHDDFALLREVIASGGSVVSHSVRHEPNWGGSYERASQEARESRDWIERHLPEAAPGRHAVSPFHQNPQYAVQALADNGYEGFIGGSIACDPEFLLGRAGRAPLVEQCMMSLSAQCMMHGDCFHRQGNAIDIYRQSFAAHLAAGGIFAYLDHPFSPRYQYGWHSEGERIAAHRDLIEHIGREPDIWWASIEQVFEFLSARDRAKVSSMGARLSVEYAAPASGVRLAIRWKGRQFVY